MAHMLVDWVVRRQTTWPVGTAVNEVIVIGDPIDVGDWEQAIVQFDTLAVSGGYSASEIGIKVQTAISNDEHAYWQDCLAATPMSAAVDQSYMIQINSAESVNSPPTASLRKWARLVAVHLIAASNNTVTVHAALLLKKRTP